MSAAKKNAPTVVGSGRRGPGGRVSNQRRHSQATNAATQLSSRKVRDSRTTVLAAVAKGERLAKANPTVQHTTPAKAALLTRLMRELAGNGTATQEARLVAALQRVPVSTIEARKYLDIMCPAARVSALRDAGHDIVTMWVQQPAEAGRMHRFGQYMLMRGAKAKGTM